VVGEYRELAKPRNLLRGGEGLSLRLPAQADPDPTDRLAPSLRPLAGKLQPPTVPRVPQSENRFFLSD
jgi:hypothetical protein